jgi:hypothetical protein
LVYCCPNVEFCFQAKSPITWDWEYASMFDAKIVQIAQATSIKWVDISGTPVDGSGGVTVSQEKLEWIINGKSLGDSADLQ